MCCVSLLPLLAGCGGCSDSTATSRLEDGEGPAASGQYREELLTYAVDNLDRLDEYGVANVQHQIRRRLEDLSQSASEKSGEPFDALLDAWPEPEMLRQIVDRLNQWIRPQKPSADWKLDPMVATLPKPLADLPQVKDLGQMEFSLFDGYALQEATWLRDVSLWSRGDRLDDLERARSLFDWVVRNVQIEADSPARIPLFPWETLLFGRGTAEERAWVFVLLLRQLELDVDAALLAVDEGQGVAGSPATQSIESNPRLWCVGVLIEGKVYLFDPLLGLPIPAPNGVARDQSGQLAIQPATLDQVRADDKLLRRMDANETRVYWVKASELTRVTALFEASPAYLSCRMKMLESRLSGDRKMVLTTSPSAISRRWMESGAVAEVRLWRHPFLTLLRRSNLDRNQVAARLAALLPYFATPSAPLYRGRVLYLKGTLVGDGGAMKYFQEARPSNAELKASSLSEIDKLVLWRGKQDASYWSGLIAFQRGNYSAAEDYFLRRTLTAYRNGFWTRGARYNLARTYESLPGRTEMAILQYGSDASSPGYLGDLLRAKWLRESIKSEKPKEEPLLPGL